MENTNCPQCITDRICGLGDEMDMDPLGIDEKMSYQMDKDALRARIIKRLEDLEAENVARYNINRLCVLEAFYLLDAPESPERITFHDRIYERDFLGFDVAYVQLCKERGYDFDGAVNEDLWTESLIHVLITD